MKDKVIQKQCMLPKNTLLPKISLLIGLAWMTVLPLLAQRGVDTRVGTAPATTHTAGLFGKNTEEFGQTLPAVLEPHGMNFWTPQTRHTEKKCIAPYYYRDTLFQGFRNSHWIVGGCTQDYGSFTLSPSSKPIRFSHVDEVATPSYYQLKFPGTGLQVELTARSRSAIFRFTYQTKGRARLVVQVNSDEEQGSIEVDTVRGEIRGSNPVHRIYQGWGEPAGFSGHFVVQLQKDIQHTTLRGDTAEVEFDVEAGEVVLVKAASSFCDIEGARRNLQSEIPHWDFDRTRNELVEIWNRRFSLIEVEAPQAQKSQFYGALYRASFLPRTVNDVDGRYPSFSTGTPIRRLAPGETYYDDYSMWDTYRALHPLFTLLTPHRSGQMMQSLVLKARQGGWLPIFPCWGSYTAAMIGDHCIAAIGDAYCKGIRNFDVPEAYEAMRKNAFDRPATREEYRNGMGRRALDSYLTYGYIPLEDSVPDAFHTCEQVSRTLEYAYDDFVLAGMARTLNRRTDHNLLKQRARNYRHVIDPRTGYAQGRHADGTFLREANAFRFTRFITEGAPCHYTWYVPHDVYGLMECMGGKERYTAKLDSMFSERRYWHGNEPCHQAAFLFNYAGEPWKTQRAVRHIMKTEYQNTPGGLAGNDDAGQMSAWYLFAAMGFYPVCPGTPYYVMASPSFPQLTLRPEGGKPFTVKAVNASEENIYIQSARLNGQPYTHNYLTHQDIVNGGLLELVMGAEPNKAWGARPEDCPPDVMREEDEDFVTHNLIE